MIKKILVPYDNSRPSENALYYAINLVKNLKEQQQEIILLHVIKPYEHSMRSFLSRKVQSPKTGDKITLEQYLNDIAIESKIDVKNMLEDKIKRIQSSDYTLKSVILHGNPIEEILKLSQLENIDLIVMGNVGHKGISKIKSIGSVSRSVIENAKVPVIVVH